MIASALSVQYVLRTEFCGLLHTVSECMIHYVLHWTKRAMSRTSAYCTEYYDLYASVMHYVVHWTKQICVYAFQRLLDDLPVTVYFKVVLDGPQPGDVAAKNILSWRNDSMTLSCHGLVPRTCLLHIDTDSEEFARRPHGLPGRLVASLCVTFLQLVFK